MKIKNIKCNILYSILIIFLTYVPGLTERYFAVNQYGNITEGNNMGTDKIIHWPGNSVSWYLNEDGSGYGQYFYETQETIENAFDSWENVSTADVSFSYAGSTSATCTYDSKNVFYWAVAGDPIYDYPNGLSGGAIATTVITFNSSTAEILDADIVFDGRDQDWFIDGTEYWDIQGVATHEIGHLLGLAHTNISGATMYSNGPSIPLQSLEFDDKTGISFLYGGNLIDDETFSGTDYYNWDLNVLDGKTLTISPGATINFSEGKFLKIYGTLVADGTSVNNITFDELSSNDGWWGIKFEDSSSDDFCSLSYCNIKNASYGVYCNKANPNINECSITDNGYGIYLNQVSPTSYNITNNTISGNSNHGIYDFLGSSKLSGNTITYNDKRGIYAYGSSSSAIIKNNSIHDNGEEGIRLFGVSPDITGNLIYSNTKDGVYCEYYCTAYFNDGDDTGNNSIVYNAKNGIYIESSSLPVLSAISDEANSTNSIYSNYSATTYDVYSLNTSSTVMAEYNYWGGTPSAGHFYGDVDYDPWRSSLPKRIAYNPDPAPDLSSSSDQDYSLGLQSDAEANKIFNEGYDLEIDRKYDEALNKFKTVISDYPESFEAMMALSRLDKCLNRSGKQSQLESDLNTFYQPNKDHVLGGKVLEMKVPILLERNSFSEAIEACETIIKNFPNSVLAREALFRKWAIYFDDMSDLGAAKTTMDLYGKEYGNNENHIFMRMAMGEINADEAKALQKSQSKPPASNSASEVPVSFELSDNYPNPFNPETKIQIKLPKNSNVNLQIFNIRGQVVATVF